MFSKSPSKNACKTNLQRYQPIKTNSLFIYLCNATYGENPTTLEIRHPQTCVNEQLETRNRLSRFPRK